MPAIGLHESVDLLRDLPFIENIASFLADQAQRLGERRILENVAFSRAASFTVERVGFEEAAGQTFVKLGTKMPVKRNQFGNRETFFRVLDRGRQIVAEL